MKVCKKILLGLFLLSLCFSCTKKKPAPVLNRSKNVYGKNSEFTKGKYRDLETKDPAKDSSKSVQSSDVVKNSAKETSVANSQPQPQPSQSAQVEVVAGDTLYSLSKKYQVTVHDLIKQNDLSAPYTLKAGTRLTIPSAKYHEVKNGETLYAISRIHGMRVDELIAMNGLKEPYSVKAGEKIRISKFEEKPVETKSVLQKSDLPPSALQNQVVEPEKSETLVEKFSGKPNRFFWPVRGKVISKFGPKSGGLYNDGINIKAKEGEVVKASSDGVVAYVGNELKGYGNLVILKHSGGWITAYAHLKSSLVSRGQKVAQGEKIGFVGSSGNVNSPQLYFGLRKGRDALNPEVYLKAK